MQGAGADIFGAPYPGGHFAAHAAPPIYPVRKRLHARHYSAKLAMTQRAAECATGADGRSERDLGVMVFAPMTGAVSPWCREVLRGLVKPLHTSALVALLVGGVAQGVCATPAPEHWVTDLRAIRTS